MLLDTVSTEIFVRSLARTSNLSVVFFEEEDGQPYTDPVRRTVHVARPRWHWPELQYNQWLGAVCHELGHHRGGNGDLMQYFVDRKVNTKSLYGTVVNILLDWINDAQWIKYPGAHLAVQAVQVHCAERGINFAVEPPKDKRARILTQVFSWIYNRRAETYQRGLMPIATKWEIIVPHSYSAYNSDLADLLLHPSGESVSSLARKIIDEDSDEDETEGDGDEGNRGEGESDGDGGDGQGNPSDEEGSGDSDAEGAWISYRDLLMKNQDDHTHHGKPHKVLVKYDHDPEDSYVPFGDKYKEIDLGSIVR